MDTEIYPIISFIYSTSLSPWLADRKNTSCCVMGLIYDIQFPGLQAQQHLWRDNDQPGICNRGATADEGLVKRMGGFFLGPRKRKK